MMSQDDFFSDPTVVELPIEDEGYRYDANYHVRVWADTNDVRLIESYLSMELDGINELGYWLSIKDTKKLVAIRDLKKFVVRVLSLIDLAVNNGATLFIRIDESKALDELENEERKPLFANVASKDVRINTKLLMGVLKEIGAHRDLSVCIKVEG